ncbi:MAG: hypothetical protein ACI9T9_001660 [Oleiphilaceae bacterium]|jgi:hypothetical protein
MKKQLKKTYMGKAILLTTSMLAVSAIYTLSINQALEPQDNSQTLPQANIEQMPKIIVNQQTVVTSNKATKSSADSTMLDNNALSIDSLKKMLFPEGDPAWAWAKVDIDRLQSEMPDNLYWELAAPTADEWLIEHRKETKAYWDEAYGQILSNNASEQQIRDYYSHQHQVSTDYIVFATQLLNRHINDLPERDVSFQKLARNLHLARLEELPKKLTNAMERRKAQEARRAAWLADKTSFEEALRIEKEDAEILLKSS